MTRHTYSASQINNFMNEPILWALKSLYKLKEPQNGYALRGTVFGDYLEQAVLAEEFMLDLSDDIKAKLLDECDKNQCDMPAVTNIQEDWLAALAFFKKRKDKGWQNPQKAQSKIEFTIDSNLTVIGYLDLEYENAIIDIKYRNVLAPSSGKSTDLIQLAIYRKALGKAPFLVEICKGKVKLTSYFGDVLDHYYAIAKHNLLLMEDLRKQIMPYVANKDYSILRCVSVHNPDYIGWFPEAKRILQENILP